MPTQVSLTNLQVSLTNLCLPELESVHEMVADIAMTLEYRLLSFVPLKQTCKVPYCRELTPRRLFNFRGLWGGVYSREAINQGRRL